MYNGEDGHFIGTHYLVHDSIANHNHLSKKLLSEFWYDTATHGKRIKPFNGLIYSLGKGSSRRSVVPFNVIDDLKKLSLRIFVPRYSSQRFIRARTSSCVMVFPARTSVRRRSIIRTNAV